MFFKSYSMILWKEYRQQKMLAVSLFLTAIGFHLLFIIIGFLSSWERGTSFAVEPGIFYGVALVVSGLYTACSASIIYCNEQEEQTFSLLRNLPVSRMTLLFGKASWVLLSAFMFFVLNFLIMLLMVFLFSGNLFPSGLFPIKQMPYQSWQEFYPLGLLTLFLVFWHLFGCIIAPFCLGLFWSTRTKNSLNAILATIGTMLALWMVSGVLAQIASDACSLFFGQFSSETWAWFNATALTFFLVGFTSLFGIAALILGYFWFDLWKDHKALFRSFRPPIEENEKIRKMEYAAAHEISVHKRSEFWTLFFHAIRQSFGLFAWAFVFGAITCIVMSCFFTKFLYDYESGVTRVFFTLFLGVGVAISYIFCANIFTADQKTQGAFLAERGVSPRKIWWSRVLAFGSVYFVILAAVFASMYLSTVIGNFSGTIYNSEYNSGAKQWVPIVKYHGTYEFKSEWAFVFLLYTIPQFFAGVFVSMFTRSGIVSTFGTVFCSWTLLTWGALTQIYLGVFTFLNGKLLPVSWSNPVLWWLDFTVIWCFLPVVLGLLLASRLRTADWLRQRRIWKSRRPVLTCMALPFVLICAVMPLYRIYAIPKVDYGYRFSPEIFSKDFHYKPLESDAEKATSLDFISSSRDIKTLRSRYEIVKQSYLDPYQADIAAKHPYVENEVLSALDNLFPKTPAPQTENETDEEIGHVPPEVLDEVFDFARKLQFRDVAYTERVKRVYEYNIHALKSGNVGEFGARLFRFCPWEKSRLLRQYDYEFQMSYRTAEQIDKLENMFQSTHADDSNVEEFIEKNKFYSTQAEGLKQFSYYGPDFIEESSKISHSAIVNNATGVWFDSLISRTSMMDMDSIQMKAMYLKRITLWSNLLLRLGKMKKAQEEKPAERQHEESQPPVNAAPENG